MKKVIFGMIIMLVLIVIAAFSLNNNSIDCPIPTSDATPTSQATPTKECTPTPEDTLTPAPKLEFPTPTIPKLFSTPTDIPEGTATVIVPTFTDSPDPKRKTKTPTSTAVLVYQTPISECNNNCLCLLVTQAVIANDLERTQIAIDLQQNSCKIP